MTSSTSPARRKRITAKDIHFDVDEYLNPYLPSNPIKRLPKPIARFLGYRKEPAAPIGNILVSLWALVGAFLGLLVVSTTYKFSGELQTWHPPVLFASLVGDIPTYPTIQNILTREFRVQRQS
jgi:hypothetical protein